jgi:NTP pyrophosphatase (non-canonical NTP hydrolase)
MSRIRKLLETVTLREFSRANAARCQDVFHSVDAWSQTDWATALAGEVGEYCNLVKKRRRGEAIPDQLIADELGDILAYLDLNATAAGLDLSRAAVSKFNAVSERVRWRGAKPSIADAVLERAYADEAAEESLPHIYCIDDGEWHHFAARSVAEAVQAWQEWMRDCGADDDLSEIKVVRRPWAFMLSIDHQDARGVVEKAAIDWAREYSDAAPCQICSSVY